MSLTAEQREKLDERIRRKGGYFAYGCESSTSAHGANGEVEVEVER